MASCHSSIESNCLIIYLVKFKTGRAWNAAFLLDPISLAGVVESLPQRLRNVPQENKEKHGQPKTGHDNEVCLVPHASTS
jgi:hypothetical protein